MEKAGVANMVWYNYRRVPAVALAHQLVQSGAIGRVYHARACYLQSWGGPETPLLWRFQGDVAGSGAHGDLNAHIIDAVRFVTGEEITTVEGAIEHTFKPGTVIPLRKNHSNNCEKAMLCPARRATVIGPPTFPLKNLSFQ